MAFRDLFIARTKVALPGLAVAAAAAPEASTGVFITPQSLAAFPGASLAVTVIWLLAKRLVPSIGSSPWVPFIASFVGAVIFVFTVSDAKAAPETRRQWVVAIAIAVFNSLYLAASALGLLR